MKKFLTLRNILLTALGLCIIAGAVISLQPGNGSISDDAGRFDTQSFASYARGEVIAVEEERQDEFQGNQTLYQKLQVKLLSGNRAGETITTEFTRILDTAGAVQFQVGDKVVLGQLPPTPSEELVFEDLAESEYVIVDRWRSSGLIIIAVVFITLAVWVGRKQGVWSLAGLVATGVILLFWTAPQLLVGKDAILVSLVTAGLVAVITMLISHGNNWRSRLSVVSTLISLAVAFAISFLFVQLGQLFGLGQSDAFALQTGFLGEVDLRGLLLGGLMISLLGILDDVTTTQTSAVAELKAANPALSQKELFQAGMAIGREHIASLINTLILVYVGASLPLLLLIMSATDQPLWVLLNSEFMAEEIVRALSGSVALILAVPISTALVAWYLQKLERVDN